LRRLEGSDWGFFSDLDRCSEGARSVDRLYLPRTSDGYRAWAEREAARSSDDDTCFLVIESLADGVPVGSIGVNDADRRAGRYMHGLATHPDFRRRGFAAEAIVLLERYMFGELRYHKCEVDVYAFNEASIALHEKVGFVREGLMREHEYFAGRYLDAVRLGMTADDFAGRYRYFAL
jgi:RimJ/RimL family protein N-acetyltransferase